MCKYCIYWEKKDDETNKDGICCFPSLTHTSLTKRYDVCDSFIHKDMEGDCCYLDRKAGYGKGKCRLGNISRVHSCNKNNAFDIARAMCFCEDEVEDRLLKRAW